MNAIKNMKLYNNQSYKHGFRMIHFNLIEVHYDQRCMGS